MGSSLLDNKEKRDADIITLRKMGWSLQKIGDQYHLTRERIRQIIDVYNESAPDQEKIPHFKISAKNYKISKIFNEVTALLATGKSFGEIVLDLGISAPTAVSLKSLLVEKGVLLPYRQECSKIDLEVAKRMRAAGATFNTIAERFGVSVPAVRHCLRK